MNLGLNSNKKDIEPTFFVVCPIGFEEEVIREIKEVWPLLIEKDGIRQLRAIPQLTKIKGGIELNCPFHIGLQLNYFLKIASRVLLRLHRGKCSHIAEFKKCLREIAWEPFCKGRPESIKFSSQGSRLSVEKQILEECHHFYQKRFKDAVAKVNLYIRFANDLLTISLDTSGEHLHRRSYAKHRGKAPLRENIAAFCLRKMVLGEEIYLAKKSLLWDPFCGSGTIPLEAACFFSPNFDRAYSFLNFPSCPKIFRSPAFHANYRIVKNFLFRSCLGYDIDPEVISACLENQKTLGDKAQCPVQFVNLNSLNQDSLPEKHEIVWVLTNPPYDHRLHSEKDFFQKFVEMIEKVKVARVGILMKDQALGPGVFPANWKSLGRWPVNNGGIQCTFLVLKP